MSEVLPDQCQIALKEWASVVEAFARGDQVVLIRKGGLAEATTGFELLSRLFVFYPTFEHQTVKFLRSPYQRYLEEALAHKPSDGQVRIELYGVAVSSTQTHDPTVVERLRLFHIYNEQFLNQRLQWQPDQPLVVCVVRAFRLASPHLLPVLSRYAGCRSWVDLEQGISLDGAIPVLDEQIFQDRLQQINALLQ